MPRAPATPAVAGADGPLSQPADDAPHIKYSFHNGGCETFHEHLVRALGRKSWIVEDTRKKATEPRRFSHREAGIGGVLRRREEKRREQAALTDEAFSDIDALMQKAKDVVRLAERIAAERKRREAAASGAGAAEEGQRLGDLLLGMGITSPVTRAGTGAQYHEELARQLSHFLRVPLERAGGLMVLPDVYCLYNRARGTELVSPEDLLAACELLQKLSLGMRLRAFDSGVKVVQADSFSEEATTARLTALLDERGNVSAPELASAWGIPLAVAKELLLTAELAGRLCRSDNIRGLRFYPNLFLTKYA